MKKPILSRRCLQPVRDPSLEKILRRCGAYYHSADLFYQELWRQQLRHLGFRVLKVERLPYHPVWDIRLCGNLSTQTYLLVSQAVPAKWVGCKDLLCRQLASAIQRIARDLGPPIKRDCFNVVRKGAYFTVSFVWPPGKPGCLLKREKPVEAFSFFIRPWVRKHRN